VTDPKWLKDLYEKRYMKQIGSGPDTLLEWEPPTLEDYAMLCAHLRECREALSQHVVCEDICASVCVEDCAILPEECKIGHSHAILTRDEPPEVK